MSSQKRQHFVPQCYLKSWTINNELYSLPLQAGIIRKQPTKSIAKKDNLYTLPSIIFKDYETGDRRYKELISENIFFKIWEDRWSEVLNAIKNDTNLDFVLNSIKGFVITQSFRTPKFMRLNKQRMERYGKGDEFVNEPSSYAFLASKGLTDYIQNCTCQIIRCMDTSNFITTDNPATHWFQEGDLYYHTISDHQCRFFLCW